MSKKILKQIITLSTYLTALSALPINAMNFSFHAPLCQQKTMDLSLHDAVQAQDLEVIDICIWDLKININSIDKNGKTPLHIAAEQGYKKVTKHLIIQGANLSIKDNFNKTAADVGTPQTAAYIRLAQDFYAALCGEMLFKTFAEKWLTAKNYIRFASKLLFVQPLKDTEAFSHNFYSWCHSNKKTDCLILKKGVQKTKNTDLIEEKNLIVLEPTQKKTTIIIPAGSQLHQAAAEGNLILLERLLLAGKDIYKKDDEGQTPFDIAMKTDQVDAAWRLLLADKTYRAAANKIPFKLFANTYLTTEENCLFIKKLISDLDPEFLGRINKFLEKKEPPKVKKPLVKSTNECQCLPQAIQLIADIPLETFKTMDEISRKKTEYRLIDQFKKIRGELKEMSPTLNTALHYAALWNMRLVALFLIKNGLDINEKNRNGDTALHIGALSGNLDIINTLICSGANSALKNNEEKTALIIAAEENNREILKHLTEASPSPTNHVDEDGNTALHIVAKNNYFDAISYLHTAGFNLNALNDQQRTPLHLAAANEATKSVSELIKLGAISKPDVFEKTPLQYAVELENEEMVYLLAKQGVSVLKKDPAVESAYDSASRRLTSRVLSGPSKNKLRRIVDYLGMLIERPHKNTLSYPALILLKQRASAYTLQCLLKKIQTNKKLYDCKICFKK